MFWECLCEYFELTYTYIGVPKASASIFETFVYSESEIHIDDLKHILFRKMILLPNSTTSKESYSNLLPHSQYLSSHAHMEKQNTATNHDMNSYHPMEERYINIIKGLITDGVHKQNFKNGAFKSQITPSLSAAQSLKILRTSPLLTDAEKKPIFIMRRCLMFGLRKDKRDLMPFLGLLENLYDVFNDDAKSRGMYVPEPMMQSMG
jgi:hypothetical protein